MSVIDAIRGLRSQKTLSDEALVTAGAIRIGRGELIKDKEAIDAALARLGRDADYLSEKVAIIASHTAALLAEANRAQIAAAAAELRKKDAALVEKVEPLLKQLDGIRANLAELDQQLTFNVHQIVGAAASIRERHPELFPGA